MSAIIEVKDLRLSIPAQGGPARPVDGVSFSLSPGECVGLVGESGSGKSLTSQTLIGLTREIPGVKIEGSVRWQPEGEQSRELLKMSERELTSVRGGEIGMVFQDPLSCLNPLFRVDYQIGEVLARHCGLKGQAAFERTVELLDSVGVPQPEQRARQYPHQLSGGLRQRVILAMTLAGEPRMLIADEPTTALDVTVQAQILRELGKLRRERGLAILFITHDLGVVAQVCDRVMVMYAGRIVEQAPVKEFFDNPRHPYSRGLLESLPTLSGDGSKLTSIPGSPPQPGSFPPGCRFCPRCDSAIAPCQTQYPPHFGDNRHSAACWLLEDSPVASSQPGKQ
ncbi:MAG: ABC transporter ATP-binding protein [Planctomycetales bacterium]|nr:ABC transporter ATP-binding protein [bacterium]UNM09863.1 MAG: ABC transporter ATP-binding protein [Planctomycetales bacterium]